MVYNMAWIDILKFGGPRPHFKSKHSSSLSNELPEKVRQAIKTELESRFSPQGEEDQCCEYVKDLYNKRLYKRYEEAVEMVKGMSLTPERRKEIDAKLKDLKLSSDDHKKMIEDLSCDDFMQYLENEKGNTLGEELFDITGLLKEWEECKGRMD